MAGLRIIKQYLEEVACSIDHEEFYPFINSVIERSSIFILYHSRESTEYYPIFDVGVDLISLGQ